ncbi:GNAT family N-acetyltransferase [Aerococcaceae bacterium DSM 111020]|nr:GNAT family N-acetyltransferase [Aerococcaceae bacterium DSM 111020]
MEFQWTKGNNAPVYEDALRIRQQVFIDEQQIDAAIELDDLDAQCYHWVGYLDHTPIATARLLPINKQTLKIQRFAVVGAQRRTGAGRTLMDAIEVWAKNNHYQQFILSAQDPVIPFYQSLGYDLVDSDGYLEAGIPHHDMVKHIAKY